ncbi:MAG: hypothetical protein ABI823_00600 [Bryobacteraceae bacterium]
MKRFLTPSLAVLLFAVNAYVCRELFRTEWLVHMGSIEGAYIGISRWILEHFPDLSWMPAWYGGIPFQNTYPPLMHFLVALTAKAGAMSPALAHHATSAFFYCLGPVALFALALRWSGSRLASFVVAAGYSLLSPSAWLIADVAHDLGSRWHPRRLQAMVYYGETTHVPAMTWLVLAILCVDIALERRKPVWYCAAILTLAATVATNWIAAFALGLAMIAYLLARPARLPDWVRLVLLAVAAYALVSPWMPPSTIRVIQDNARTIGGDFRGVYAALPKWLALGAAALALLKWLTSRLGWTAKQQFALYFVFLLAGLTLPAAWADISIVPQPIRYHLEMELALWLAAAMILARLPGRALQMSAAAILLLCVWAGRQDRHYARGFLIRPIDITKRVEYKTGKWLDANLKDGRVMVPGSTSFFLQAFTDTPQLGGGFENGTTNFNFRAANYTLYVGSPPAPPNLGMLWLKALGIQAVAYGGKDSGEYYKPFQHPEQYAKLETLWRDGGDAIGRVPQRSTSLARVVTRKDLANIESYVAALDDPALPLAEWRWTSQHSGHIQARLAAYHLISIQESWAPGWHATANGIRREVAKDGLGLMLVEPGCDGECTVDLVYDGGPERQLAIAASFFTMLMMAAFVGGGLRKNR